MSGGDMKQHGTLIRRVAPSDEHGLRELWREFGQVFTKEKLARPLGIEWMQQYKNEDEMIEKAATEFATDPKHICFVAEREGVLVGFVSGCLNVDDDRVYDSKGSIEDWFVSEAYRGEGIGRRLWDALMDEFVRQDCSWLELNAFASNPAIEFYKSQGFTNSTVTMVKKLKDIKEEV